MPSQARTVISAFRFATVAPDSATCSGDIRAGIVRMSYALAGMPAININTRPGGPVPAPPAPEPPAPAGQDPVRILIDNGWKVTDWVLKADGTNTGQPAGFGLGKPYAGGMPPKPAPPANTIFDNLDLMFEFPFFCTCVATRACRAARYRLSVKYDGSQHPVITVETSDEGACGNVGALLIDKEVGPPLTALMGGKATYTFKTGVTCPCPKPKKGGGDAEEGGDMGEDDGQGGCSCGDTKPGQDKQQPSHGKSQGGTPGLPDDGDGENGYGGAGAAQNQCPLDIVVEYEFRTVL